MAAYQIYRAENTGEVAISRTRKGDLDVGSITQSGTAEPILVLVGEGMDRAAAAAAIRAIADEVAACE